MTKRHDSASALHRAAAGTVGSAFEARAKRLLVHEVRERALAVDLDDREELAIPRLEGAVTADVDQLELEADVPSNRLDDIERALAERARRSVVDDDPAPYGYNPLVVVASATRCTARP